jgi:hypothetical protein
VDDAVSIELERAGDRFRGRAFEHADLDDVVGSKVARQGVQQGLRFLRQQRALRRSVLGEVALGLAIDRVGQDRRDRICACDVDPRDGNVDQRIKLELGETVEADLYPPRMSGQRAEPALGEMVRAECSKPN